MMTQQLEVSVLSAPLAAIDRRTLSQAWYSALRLARTPQSVPASPRKPSGGVEKARPHEASECVSRSGERDAAASRARRCIDDASKKRSELSPQRVERRAPRSVLARQVERILLDPRGLAKRATLSLESGSGRVHVVLQSRGNRVHLVALCPPRLRDAVARALAQARYALASRGFVVDVETEAPACS